MHRTAPQQKLLQLTVTTLGQRNPGLESQNPLSSAYPLATQAPYLCVLHTRHFASCWSVSCVLRAGVLLLSVMCLDFTPESLGHSTWAPHTGAPGPEGTVLCASRGTRHCPLVPIPFRAAEQQERSC